jgi:hypothetical protein
VSRPHGLCFDCARSNLARGTEITEKSAMNGALISDIHGLAGQTGVTIEDSAEQVELHIARSGIGVSIAVPRSALQFSIEVRDARGTRLIEDRLDYSCYDAAPEQRLADEMRAEVLQFLERLLIRSLRMTNTGILEWQSGGRWLQAVPYVPDTEFR